MQSYMPNAVATRCDSILFHSHMTLPGNLPDSWCHWASSRDRSRKNICHRRGDWSQRAQGSYPRVCREPWDCHSTATGEILGCV